LLKQPSATDSALKPSTQRFFGGSAGLLVTRLVDKDLSAEQIKNIQLLIDEHRRKERKKQAEILTSFRLPSP